MAGGGRPLRNIIGTEEVFGEGYLDVVVEEHYNIACTYTVTWYVCMQSFTGGYLCFTRITLCS